jgi:hypothetical protein
VIDYAAVFNRAADILTEVEWYRSSNDETTSSDSKCIWLATADAFAELVPNESYLDGRVWLPDRVVNAIAAVDSSFVPPESRVAGRMQTIFDWNDHSASSKEQVVEALRKAAEMAGTNA